MSIGTCRAVASAATIAVLLTSPLPSFAQLEEIIVTARKRDESLQMVPISVQAVSGEEISAQGLYDLAALTPYTPNFSMVQAPGASDLFFMRGLGTYGSGIHFEPSVGQVFNGYFSTRSRLSRTALIDVAQVEVLKGPQGAIIGKNTSLGALNITSNRPTEEFQGSISAAYNTESSEGYELQAILSGSLSDNVRGRVVLDYQDIDGWLDNRVTGQTIQQKQDLTFRGMLDVDFSETFTGEFMYQYSDLDRNGKARESVFCFDEPAANALGVECNIDAANDAANLQRNSPGGPVFDPGEPYTSESHLLGATLTWQFENFDLTSLSNFTSYEINDNFSGAITPVERASIRNTEEYDQFYQEIRLTSTSESGMRWIVGGMYFSGDMEFFQAFDAVFAGGLRRNEFARSETDSLAGFGQIDVDLGDAFTLTLGARYTTDDRTGAKSQIPGPIYTAIPNTIDNVGDPSGCGPGFRACTNGDGSPITGEIDDSGTSYNATLAWNLSDTSMLYVTSSTGFKSGGFDLRGAGDPTKFIFGEEETTNFELGGRHTLANGRARLNWTLYQTDVDDLQVSSNDPILIQQVVSAANASSKGLEGEFVWAATDAFNLSLAAAFIETEFDGFLSECYAGQSPAAGCNFDVGGGVFFQNQDGMDLPFAPEVQYVAGADYTFDVGTDGGLRLGAKYIYIDEHHVTLTRDPAAFQDSTSRVDASLTLYGNTDGGNPWDISLVGRNLSDEQVKAWCNSSGLSGTLMVSCAFEEGRFVSLRGTIGF
jgi:iron complex outermembrane receptor protein